MPKMHYTEPTVSRCDKSPPAPIINSVRNGSIPADESSIGRRIRAFRKIRGMSQTVLGKKIGVSFQQIQKYELGKNRVSASMIVRIAKSLDVRISDILEEPNNVGLVEENKTVWEGDFVGYYSSSNLLRAVAELLVSVADRGNRDRDIFRAFISSHAAPSQLESCLLMNPIASRTATNVQSASVNIDLAQTTGDLHHSGRVGRPEMLVELTRDVNARLPSALDLEVGRRIRERRRKIGMPQTELAVRIGVSVGMVSRYETGLTRVAAGRLIAIADALGIPVQELTHGDHAPHPDDEDAAASRQVTLLLQSFSQIASPALRTAIIEFARSIGNSDPRPAFAR